MLGAAAAPAWPGIVAAQHSAALSRPIPSTGERLPAIGLGTWLTFNVIPGAATEAPLERLNASSAAARAIDCTTSSPKRSLATAPEHRRERLFVTKIWCSKRWDAGSERSRELWKVLKFDLVHIHNMLDWNSHIETLKDMKAAGTVRYIGITTSHGWRHEEMEQALLRERFDFAQFTYNLSDRRVEERLLPLAADRGMAVVVNRPFDGGNLFSVTRKGPLPAWAREFDCENWAQFFLKFVVSHPSVTCAIPATSKVAHLRENIGALYGRLPDVAERARMAKHFESL